MSKCAGFHWSTSSTINWTFSRGLLTKQKASVSQNKKWFWFQFVIIWNLFDRIAIINGEPYEHTSVASLKVLIETLKSIQTTDPVYVHVWFVVNFLVRHLFPPFDALFAMVSWIIFFAYRICITDPTVIVSFFANCATIFCDENTVESTVWTI